MEDKIRIKDLLETLDVPPKEMLRALRELGLPGRTTSGSVAPEDAERLRSYFAMRKTEERRSVQPNVIVRKRRKEPARAPVAEEMPEPAAPIVEKKPSVEVAPPVEPAEAAQAPTPEPAPVEKPQKKPARVVGARVISRPGDEKPKPSVPEPVVEKPAKKSEPEEPKKSLLDEIREREAARLEAEKRQLEEDTPQPAPSALAVETEEELPAIEPKDDLPATEDDEQPRKTVSRNVKLPHLGSPDASAQPDGDTRQRHEDRGQKQGQTARVVAPAQPTQVRVISRPAAPAESARKPRPGQPRPDAVNSRGPAQRPGAFRGTGARPAAALPGQGRQAPGQPLPDQGIDGREGQSKKKRLKGRRTVVDFPQGDFGRHPEEDDGMRFNRGKSRRKATKSQAQPAQQNTQPLKAAKRKIRVTEAIRVADMAHQLGVKANEIIKVLMGLGVMATINMSLDLDTATLVASEFGYEVEKTGFSEEDYLATKEIDAPESLKPRPPVVTIMGHVDHGKTSLLDAIRKSNVTSGEAGGITQHIGAYHVKTKRGEIVFLDTPGHEAFTAMRARGAQITDLVILVVAADDGVMEQTREAINHSRAANVPIVVAVNKMDKPGADPDRVLRELSELGLQPEDWGGDTIVAKVSAKTREGLDDLLEMVALQSEIMDLKANPDKLARGHIIEAKLDKGRGPVATVLIQEGTLHTGDNFVCGPFSGRARALTNDQGKKVKEAGPSIPVEVQGFVGVPEAGEEFLVIADDKMARRIADSRAIKRRERDLAAESRVTLETFLAHHADQEALTLNLVLKADVQGSLEAISEALQKQSTDKVKINIVHGGTGAISESDIMLASASKAIIIGFNIKPTARIKDIAEHENVDIRFYDIIYKLVDDVKSAMAGLLAPVRKEVYLGQAEVRQLYSLPKIGVIAGCYVADGKIARNAGVRLLRDGAVVYTGKIASLKRFKDDMREVVKGNECGVGLENFNDIKVGDIIEAFETVEEAATL